MPSLDLIGSLALPGIPALPPFAGTPLVKWITTTFIGLAAVWLSSAMLSASGAPIGGGTAPARSARWTPHPAVIPIALLLAVAIVAIGPRALMQSRTDGLYATILGWTETHRPLVYRMHGGLNRGTFGDDPGLYLLAPALTALGRSAVDGSWFVAAIAAVAYAATSLWLVQVVRGRASLAGRHTALVPVIVVGAWAIRTTGDVYAFPAIAALIGLVLLFAEMTGRLRSDRRLAGALAMYVATAVACTLFRGTTLAVTATIVLVSLWLFRAQSRARQAMRLAALLVVAIGPSIVRVGISSYRDAYFRGQEATAPHLDQHMFWHSIYIGLGVVPNKYGIIYRDSSAMNYVHRTDPTARYQSARYEAVVRDRVIELARHDAAFVARQHLLKAAVLALSFVILLPLVPRRRLVWGQEQARELFVASGLVALAGLLPGLLVVPVLNYAIAGVMVLLFMTPLVLMVALADEAAMSAPAPAPGAVAVRVTPQPGRAPVAS
jgi:hypothetical protein